MLKDTMRTSATKEHEKDKKGSKLWNIEIWQSHIKDNFKAIQNNKLVMNS